MSEETSKKGYGDGYHGKEKNNTSEMTKPSERMASVLGDVLTGNLFNSTQQADKDAKDYNDSYAKGSSDKKSGK